MYKKTLLFSVNTKHISFCELKTSEFYSCCALVKILMFPTHLISYITDFNTHNKLLTQKLLKQGHRYHELRKTFSKFYRQYYDLTSNVQVGLKFLLCQGLSEIEFYGDLMYKLNRIVRSNNFSGQFIKQFLIIKRLALTLTYCNRLHAWWSTLSGLATLLSSLIARRWVRLQTL